MLRQTANIRREKKQTESDRAVSFVLTEEILQKFIRFDPLGGKRVELCRAALFYAGSRLNQVFPRTRSEEHTSELQSHVNLVCRLLLEKKKKKTQQHNTYTQKKKQKKNKS